MNINEYVWKDKRLTNNYNEQQVSYKLIDMDEYSLNQAYNHCKNMLYNKNPKNLGRLLVLEEIAKQRNYCYTELALRWFTSLKEKDGSLLYTNESLLLNLRAWQSAADNKDLIYISQYVQVPPEFKYVKIEDLKLACRDALPLFNHSKLSVSFLYRYGIYFTQQELEELNKVAKSSSLKEKIEIVKQQLNISPEISITINSSGLTEEEFSSMIHLKHYSKWKHCKYSELSTLQLQTLTKKVLFAFEDRVNYQINTWKTLMAQITEVAEYHNYQLL